jgi:hypothetical protein
MARDDARRERSGGLAQVRQGAVAQLVVAERMPVQDAFVQCRAVDDVDEVDLCAGRARQPHRRLDRELGLGREVASDTDPLQILHASRLP